MDARRVLVPLDLQEPAHNTVFLLRLAPLLHAPDAEVHLLTVIGPHGALGYDAARDALLAVPSHPALADLTPFAHVRVGEPADEILNEADALEPAVVAMATHGRRAAGRFLFGSVAERVARNCRWPLLLASPEAIDAVRDAHAFAFDHVWVPLDGSSWSNRVAPAIVRALEPFAPAITLHHVLDPPSTHASRVPTASTAAEGPAAQAAADPVFEAARQGLVDAGLRVTTAVSFGEPAAQICEAADAAGADCIAMTTHGRSGVGRWAYGSVAEKVLRGARRPLLLVRPPAPPRPRG